MTCFGVRFSGRFGTQQLDGDFGPVEAFLAVAPWNHFDLDAAAIAFHVTHGREKDDGDAGNGNVLELTVGQFVVDRPAASST
ncbi:hypothetical protein GC170_18100 [bacterium]|nr:hypothetical protein [bacterium]